MTADGTDRKLALRSVLVDRVASDAARQRPWRLGAVIAAVAIVAGSAGAVSASALTQSPAYEDNLVESIALSAARGNSVAVGTPYFVTAESDASITLGAMPSDATGFAVKTNCLEPGTIDISINGSWSASISCDAESPTGGGGWVFSPLDSEIQVLSFEASTGFESFIAWVAEPPLPPVSRQQESELADGVVTRDEYISAFSRFVGCMGAAGYDVLGDVSDETVFDYSIETEAVDSGADDLCYVSQFGDVDAAWQLQNEATSESTRYLYECLLEHGITPSDDYRQYWPQLQAAGVDGAMCGA